MVLVIIIMVLLMFRFLMLKFFIVIKKTFFGNGYARILKKVFLSNVAKRKNLNFITGHVISGRTAKFKGNISLIENVHNWQGTGLTFEFYRRIL